jgi:hypothetical protein
VSVDVTVHAPVPSALDARPPARMNDVAIRSDREPVIIEELLSTRFDEHHRF